MHVICKCSHLDEKYSNKVPSVGSSPEDSSISIRPFFAECMHSILFAVCILFCLQHAFCFVCSVHFILFAACILFCLQRAFCFVCSVHFVLFAACILYVCRVSYKFYLQCGTFCLHAVSFIFYLNLFCKFCFLFYLFGKYVSKYVFGVLFTINWF